MSRLIFRTALRHRISTAGQPVSHFSSVGRFCQDPKMQSAKDWSAAQYLKFNDERTRPSRDLLAQVPLPSPARIVDLGCGPGNSTEVLVQRYPESKVSGVDSSPDMIAKAKATLPQLDFTTEDLSTYRPSEPVNLFFCNAVLHWLSASDRIKVVTDLLQSQPSGGVFAFQVPDNLDEPSHELMRQTASQGPWAETLKRNQPDRDDIQSPQELYDLIGPHCSSINIWRTSYEHVMKDHQAIVEWVKGTGLRPYIDPLSKDEREAYLAEYLKRLKEAYPISYDGKVLLHFPRVFVVAVRR